MLKKSYLERDRWTFEKKQVLKLKTESLEGIKFERNFYKN
jgi:hypothetical protein